VWEHPDVRPSRALIALVTATCAVLLASCDSSETRVTIESPSATGSTGATADTGTTGVTGATGETGSPEPVPLPTPVTTVSQGERYFGVYLAAAPFGDPSLEAAVEQLAGFGVEAFPGDIACDDDAADQLGVSNELAAVAIYFERRPDAQAWVDALDPPPLGIAMVRTFCAD